MHAAQKGSLSLGEEDSTDAARGTGSQVEVRCRSLKPGMGSLSRTRSCCHQICPKRPCNGTVSLDHLMAPRAHPSPRHICHGCWLRAPKSDEPLPGGGRPFRTKAHNSPVSIPPQPRTVWAEQRQECLQGSNTTKTLPALVCDTQAVPGSRARNPRTGRCGRCLAPLREGWTQASKGVSPVSFHGLALAPLWFSSSEKK